jgi:hypothetical protein
MAELHQILGSIFRDIAQARVTSDLYSRNISKYYEQDPLLRRFPTPRTDVEEVEVDLKFVLSGLEQTAAQDEGREASTATVFTKISKDISEGFFDNIIEAAKEYPNFSADTTKKLEGFEHRIYLSQDLLLYFQRQRSHLIKEGKFDDKEARDYINQLLKKRLDDLLGDSGLTDKQQNDLEKKVFKALDLDSQLESIRKPIQESHKGDGDFKVAVEVTVDKLAETPDAAISSIKVKARVRNYVWSKVEHEGKTWRALNPE